MTTGKNLSGAEQFELRAHQLRESASWVAAAPPFARNLESYFKKE